MARRTHMIYGRGQGSLFNHLIGLRDRKFLNEFLVEHWLKPELDFERLEDRCGHAIPEPTRETIQADFEACLLSVLVDVFPELSEEVAEFFGFRDRETMPHREFRELVLRISKQATKLREAIDELVQFDLELAFPPRNTRDDEENASDRRGMRTVLKALKPAFRAAEIDFWDYVTFRKSLDYFEYFDEKNTRFNNTYSARWSETTDHRHFNHLVRGAVIALRDTEFPLSLTVPTDVSPEYESPIVAALLVLQNEWNSALAPAIQKDAVATNNYNYRQMLYLVSKILSDLEKRDAALAALLAKYR